MIYDFKVHPLSELPDCHCVSVTEVSDFVPNWVPLGLKAPWIFLYSISLVLKTILKLKPIQNCQISPPLSFLGTRKIKPVNPKRHSKYSLEGLILAIRCKEPTRWKRPCCWERLRAGGEGGHRGRDGGIALSAQWTWVWANSGRWCRTGKPGVL